MMRIYRLLCLIILIIFTNGCRIGENISDLKIFTTTAFSDRVPIVDPLPPPKPYAVFIYTASNLVDPFDQSNLSEKKTHDLPAVTGPTPDIVRRRQPLEKFPLNALFMVGTMNRDSEKWAIVRDPNESVHRVQIGNYLGLNYGEIVAVNEDSITIEELVKNPVGKWEVKQSSLTLLE